MTLFFTQTTPAANAARSAWIVVLAEHVTTADGRTIALTTRWAR